MKRRNIIIVSLLAIGVIIGVAVRAMINLSSARGTNVLLVTYDTVRADHLGCYGYKRSDTSNTDWVAKHGATFTQAITSVPVTLAAHSTILTGRENYTHGVKTNAMFFLRPEFDTLAEILTRSGYRTAAVVASFILEKRFGLAQGFSFFEDDISLKGQKIEEWYGHRVGRFEQPANEISDIALNWLEKHKKQKFFLWLHYWDAHVGNPPEKYLSQYGSYDGSIAFVDDQFGQVLSFLKNNGLLERTLIVIASDHGQLLDKYELPDRAAPYDSHGLFVYEGEIKCALIFMREGLIPEGTIVRSMVSLADIVPTIVDILGIDGEFHFDGSSLLPCMTEGAPRKLDEMYLETVHAKERYKRSGV